MSVDISYKFHRITDRQSRFIAKVHGLLGQPSYVSMGSKATPFSLKLFSFFKPLSGLIEEHLDLGPTTVRQVLNSTYLHMSLPKIPTLVEPKRKKFVLMPSNCVETFRCRCSLSVLTLF